MTRRPVIGITVDTHDKPDQYESPCGYSKSVEKAGGLPVLLPYKTDLALVPAYVDLCDGFILSGGNDIDPKVYGDAGYHPRAAPIDPSRQRFELALLAEIERRRAPVLGICLGSQMMNVYRGGSLHQYLPEMARENQLEHGKLEEGRYPRHAVTLAADSLLARTIGKTDVLANSSHKQAIRTVGRGLRVVATSPDGIIEGVEDPAFPLWVGVQWHPERLSDEDDHMKLFKLLVERASHASPTSSPTAGDPSLR
jgi:putative glutamine amidotransferase